MLRLLLGTDWVANRNRILDEITQDVREQRGNRILLVPELISHDTERRLCKVAGDTTSRFAEVLSFTRLARRVSDFVGYGMAECMDNGGRVVAMASAARQLHSKLKAYASVETRPEFLVGLVEAVDEFKRCCITAKDLSDASLKTEGIFAQKLEELALLLETYDALCQRGKRDPRDQMTLLIEQLADSNFGEEHVFYIDGFPDFTRQNMDVISHFIRVSPQVTVSMNCDSPNSNRFAFEKASHTATELIQIAKRLGVPVKVTYVDAEKNPLNKMKGVLFQGATENLHLGERLQAFRTETIHQEISAVTESIMKLVEDGARYRDIAVVCGDIPTYRDSLSMMFRRCKIPLYLSGTEDILDKTVISAVLTAMNAALGGFEQWDVLRYLKSALSPLSLSDSDMVENYAILWSITGTRWYREWTNHPLGLGEDWTQEAKESLTCLNMAREKAIIPLLHLHDSFTRANNLGQQVQALYQFFEEISLSERLEMLADELDAKGDNRSAQILNQLWEILLGALEQMYDVLGNTIWDNDTFTRLFTLLLSQYDVGTIPPVLDSVTAGNISAMRCGEVKHLFVLGALEGCLPGYGGATGVLSDPEREMLRKMGVPLTGGALEGLQAEFAEIYGVFCGARESVTVSCPAGQPSFLYRRLVELAGGEKTVTDTLGAVLADTVEAGAYLARLHAEKIATELNLGEEYTQILKRIYHSLGKISDKSIQKLYGNTLYLSASQIDKQAECRLSYFLKYGLKAKERKAVTIDPAEFGTYVHSVLENTVRKVMELGGFHKVTAMEMVTIAREYSDAYAKERFTELETERLLYLFRRNYQELEMIVKELWEELQESDFRPVDFEVYFGDGGQMPPVFVEGKNMNAKLRGYVDRVDAWQLNDKNYFRVVDYKTGKKDFDYCDIFNGIGLQMLLYLFALEEKGQNLLGSQPIPAGVQYFPARVPLIASDGVLTDEEIAEIREKAWKRKGLLLQDEAVLQAMEPTEYPKRLSYTRKKDGTLSGDIADSGQFDLLRKYVFGILSAMVDDIASGNITPNPYTRGSSHNACNFCPYHSICNDAAEGGRRNYKTMTSQRFWEEIGKERKEHG